MSGYTKNQIEHFKEQLKLLMKSGENSLMGDADELADYKLYENGRYLCTGSLKKLSKITGKDKLLLKFYADLNKKGKETGNLKLVKK